MTARRRVVALAWLGMSLASLSLPTSPTAGAAPSICVGVVVSPGALGGATSTYCAKVADGSTGSQVLYARAAALGRPAPTYRRDGLLCSIDGLPSGGCASTDATHYWSYWHRPPGAGSWQYSNEGIATYRPSDRSEEGWSWQNGGTSEAANPPPLVAVDSVCPPAAAAPPAPAAAQPAGPAAPAAVAPQAPAAAGRAVGSPTLTPATAAADARQRNGAGDQAPAPSEPAPSEPATTSAAPLPGSSQPSASSAAASEGTLAGTRRTSGSGPPLGLLAGVLLVGGIATAAGLRARRAR